MSTHQNALNGVLAPLDNQRISALSNFGGGGTPVQAAPFVQAELEVQALIVKEDEGTLNANDSLSLLALAQSCPWLKGDAVYQARALYAAFDPVYVFDGDYCSTPNAFQKEKELLELKVKLYPNPAEDYLLVQLNQPFATKNGCRVYDATGKQVAVEWFIGEDNTLFLETKTLAPGVYFVEVSARGGQKQSEKFIKQ